MTTSSAERIREIVVWVGGTLLPDLHALAEACVRGPTAAGDAQQRLRVRLLVDALTWGTITPDAFLQEVGAVCDPPLAPERVAARLLSAATVQPGMVALLSNLARQRPLRFVSDYPPPWLAALAAGGTPAPLVDAGQAVYTAQLHADGTTWCRALLAAGVVTPNHTLWIDRSTRRAVAALRLGVDAALCEDAARLRRDLNLWRLLTPA